MSFLVILGVCVAGGFVGGFVAGVMAAVVAEDEYQRSERHGY